MLIKYNVKQKQSRIKAILRNIKHIIFVSIFIYLSAQIGKIVLKPVLIMLLIAISVNIIRKITKK